MMHGRMFGIQYMHSHVDICFLYFLTFFVDHRQLYSETAEYRNGTRMSDDDNTYLKESYTFTYCSIKYFCILQNRLKKVYGNDRKIELYLLNLKFQSKLR